MASARKRWQAPRARRERQSAGGKAWPILHDYESQDAYCNMHAGHQPTAKRAGNGFRPCATRRAPSRQQAGSAGGRHRREGRPHRRHRLRAFRHRQGAGASRQPAGLLGLRRDAYPSRQVLHPRTLRPREEALSAPGDGADRLPSSTPSPSRTSPNVQAARLEKCISHGATRMRTHVEVDPKVGLRGLEGVKALIDRYKWAIDLEICVMPQEGLTNNPGTDELMVAALKNGASVVGAAPNYDTDRPAQIRRVLRDGARVRRRYRHASGQRRLGRRARHAAGLRADREVWLGRPGRDRPCSKLASMPPARHGQGGQAHGRRRRRAYGADGDRPLSRRPAHRPQRAAQRGRRQPAHRAGRALLRRLQQHPQSLHAASATASCCGRSTCRRSSPSAARMPRCAQPGT